MGVPSPHDLRHRFVSLLSLAGVPPSIIRDIAGHRKITTSHDTYTHTILDEPAERLAELKAAVGRLVGWSGEREGVKA